MSSSTGRGSSEYLHTLVGAQPSSILNYHFFVYLHSLRDTSHATILLPVRPNECPLSCQELFCISTLEKLHVQKKVCSPAFLLDSGALVTYFYKGYFFLDWSVLCRNGSSTSILWTRTVVDMVEKQHQHRHSLLFFLTLSASPWWLCHCFLGITNKEFCCWRMLLSGEKT